MSNTNNYSKQVVRPRSFSGKTTTINSKNFLVTILLLVCLAATGNLASAQIATGLNFDGTDDYVACPNISSSFSTGQVSGEAWVYANSLVQWGSIMKNWTESTGGAFHFGLDAFAETLSIYISQSNGSTVSVYDYYVLPAGSWHHVAFSADGSVLHLYVDGNEAGTPAAYDGTLYTAVSPTFIGTKPGDSGASPAASLPGFWNGSMDEIRIWNRGLSQSEIQEHMNCELTGSQSGLVAYYKLNQGIVGGDNSSETTVQDSSGNNNNGTLINFALNGSSSNWITGTVNCGATIYTYYFDGDHDGYGKNDFPLTGSDPTPPVDYVAVGGDCNDGNSAVNPGATEVCNGADDNCDGTTDEGCGTTYTYYWDADFDGYGDANYSYTTTDPTTPYGYAAVAGDCFPNAPGIYPGATEVCNSVDDNCDGTIDEACVAYTYYWDYDFDGYGETFFTITSNDPTPPGGYAALDGDCNPWDASINPGAAEACNSVDDNCDGTTDEGCTYYTYYPDGDGDGYGVDYWMITITDPTPPAGYAALDGDCNDNYAPIHPGADELCNTADDNCDGVVDEGCTTGQLPDFTKTDIYGVSHHFYGDLAAGNAVIIEFSTGWCVPSQITEPIISNVYDDICQGQGNIKLYDMVSETETIGHVSDDAYGVEYSNHYNATYPVITACHDLFIDFAVQYSQSNIPWFLIVIPDTSDPANSTVHQIVGAEPDLKNMIENILTSNGYAITPPPSLTITVDGDVCSLPTPVTLTSNQSSGIVWSTGETTQSISITAPGDYTLSYAAGCGTITRKLHIGVPATAGTLTSLSGNTACAGGKGLFTLDYSGGSPNAVLQYSLDGTNWDVSWEGYSGTAIFLNTWNAGTTVYFRVAEPASNNSVGLPNCEAYSGVVQFVSQQMTGAALEITASTDCVLPATLTSSYANGNVWSTGENTQGITVNDPNYYYVISSATCGQIYDDILINSGATTWYQDADNDGFGNAAFTLESCFQPSGYAFDGSDCNDADASIHPYTTDICNSIDDNCNGFADEDCSSYTYYFDGDEDGYGKNDFPLMTSDPTPPPGYTVVGGDCQDGDPYINPGAPEVCNGADDNCDGTTDEGCTVGALAMLSGNTACTGGKGLFTVDYSGGSAEEFQYSLDGINWNGFFYGFSGEMIFVNSWNAGTTVYLRMMIDASGTLFSNTVQFVSQQMTDAPLEITTTTDCVLPATLTSSYPNGNVWSTGENTQAITVNDPNYYYVISSATCGQVYDDLAINPSPIIWYQDADGDGWGNAAVTTESCFQPNGYVWDNSDCNDANAAIYPYASDVCNSVDDNCNGFIDEGCSNYTYYFDGDQDGYGKNDFPLTTGDPTPPPGYTVVGGDCQDGNPNINPGAPDVCNGIDDNCDGAVDENAITATITPGGNFSFCQGSTVTLVANSGSGLTYQWIKNGRNIYGATQSTYNTKKTANYQVRETNAYGCSSISSTTSLTMVSKPTATITAQGSLDLCGTNSVVLEANAGSGLLYQWVKNKGNIAGATNQTYTATTKGAYKCIVSNSAGCSATSYGLRVSKSCKEDMSELITSSLNIYPNPSGGDFTIELNFDDNISTEAEVQIINMLGMVVFNSRTAIVDGELKQEIKLDVSSGNYFVRVILEDQVYTGQAVLQR